MTNPQHATGASAITICELMPYQEATDSAFGEKAAGAFIAAKEDDGSISLVGTCPRCGGSTAVIVPEEMFLANRGSRPQPPNGASSQAESDERVIPMICRCPANHPGRPEERKGCGAYWNLTVGGQP
jgi:hypothetical protein